jgi:NADPH:quinone reductase-like Zn-dependent oxidoreductase
MAQAEGCNKSCALFGRRRRSGASRKRQMDFVRAIDAAGIKPVVDLAFDLDEIVDAFRYEASGQHFGKICLEF